MDLNWAAASGELLRREDPFLPQKKEEEDKKGQWMLDQSHSVAAGAKSHILLHGVKKVPHLGALTLIRWHPTFLKHLPCVPS